jgi:hypothetical protein
MTRALVITGPFHDWELDLFAKLIREIEQSRPEETFTMLVDDSEQQGVEAAIELLRRIFPRREVTH